MIWPLLILAFTLGLAVPPGTVDDGIAALVVTFLGLVVAGLLPAMSLVVGNVLSASHSIAQLVKLKETVDGLLGRMLTVLGLAALGALLSILLAVGVPEGPSTIGSFTLPQWAGDPAVRLVQAALVACLVVTVDRARLIGGAFGIVLNARYELCVAESRRRLDEASPSATDIEKAFPKSGRFGVRVPAGRDQ